LPFVAIPTVLPYVAILIVLPYVAIGEAGRQRPGQPLPEFPQILEKRKKEYKHKWHTQTKTKK